MSRRFDAAALAELSPEQVALRRAITEGPRVTNHARSLIADDGLPIGPFAPMLFAPALGDLVQEVGAHLRYRGTFTDRERELAILTVAAARNSAFEWQQHSVIALGAGLSDDQLGAIHHGDATVPGLSDREATCYAATRQLIEGTPIGDTLLGELRDAFGYEGAFELCVLVGYYTTLAGILDTFGW